MIEWIDLINQLKTIRKRMITFKRLQLVKEMTAKLVVNWFLHNLSQRTLKTNCNRFNQTTSS